MVYVILEDYTEKAEDPYYPDYCEHETFHGIFKTYEEALDAITLLVDEYINESYLHFEIREGKDNSMHLIDERWCARIYIKPYPLEL